MSALFIPVADPHIFTKATALRTVRPPPRTGGFAQPAGIKGGRHGSERMPLRLPKPIGPEDWKRLIENLERGATPKQMEIMKEAEEKWGKDVRDMMAGLKD